MQFSQRFFYYLCNLDIEFFVKIVYSINYRCYEKIFPGGTCNGKFIIKKH